MAVDRTYGFIGENDAVTFYNGQAVIDLAWIFFYDDEEETDFDFQGYSSAFLRIYADRVNGVHGKRIKNFTTQLTRNQNVLVQNCSVTDMTFSVGGKYKFEIGYVRSGGYDIILRYGQVEII